MSRTSFKTLALYAPTDSPQTGVADGASVALKTVTRDDTGSRKGGRSELVVIQVAGTWGGGTVNPQLTLNYGVSPEEWTNIAIVANDGTMADVALTADGVFELNIPTGVHFRLNLSSSTAASITARAHGDIEAA